jgi:poly(3-hydroxybutyrate) depolymerase
LPLPDIMPDRARARRHTAARRGVTARGKVLATGLCLLLGACAAPAPSPTPTPTPFAGTASCKACPGEPCTRPCLPALDTEGPAPLAPYSRGACPALAPGRNRDFGHNHRSFLLCVPTSTRGPFAVLFLWGAGGPAEGIAPVLAGHYDEDGFILVVPDGDPPRYPLTWDMDPRGSDADLRFFDDVLACLDEQYPVDRRRVHTTGYSTGAVFSAYLMGHRSQVLASFSSYSGGDRSPSGERLVPMPPHPIPGLLYHGGDADVEWAGKAATLSLAARMASNGQFTVVCDHGRGHVVGSSTQEMWGFLLAQPFSPGNAAAWATTGIDSKLPAYCQVR